MGVTAFWHELTQLMGLPLSSTTISSTPTSGAGLCLLRGGREGGQTRGSGREREMGRESDVWHQLTYLRSLPAINSTLTSGADLCLGWGWGVGA